MGRWQILDTSPKIICDAGHNFEGTKIVQQELRTIVCKDKHYVLGFVNDKDIGPVLDLYPRDAIYYFCKANIPRGLEVDQLIETAKQYGLEGRSYRSVSEAFIAAKENANSDDLVFIGGSTFVVAEVL
jgi:dihydrofolate synthase/folylpolyglutamate synthase